MPQKFFLIPHVAYEISPTLEQLRWTKISPSYHLKRNSLALFWHSTRYLELRVRLESHSPLILFSCSSHFKTDRYIAPSQCSKEYFPILLLLLRKLLEQGVLSCLYNVLFVLLPPFYRKADGFALGQVRSKKGTLRPSPKYLDRQYLQDTQVLLDQFWKDRSANSGTSFGSDFCLSFFSW